MGEDETDRLFLSLLVIVSVCLSLLFAPVPYSTHCGNLFVLYVYSRISLFCLSALVQSLDVHAVCSFLPLPPQRHSFTARRVHTQSQTRSLSFDSRSPSRDYRRVSCRGFGATSSHRRIRLRSFAPFPPQPRWPSIRSKSLQWEPRCRQCSSTSKRKDNRWRRCNSSRHRVLHTG